MKIQPWNLFFFLGYVAYFIIRGIFESRVKGNKRAVNRTGWSERLLLLIMAVGALILPLTYLFSPWLRFADYHPPVVLRWIGAAVMVTALWLFWRSHADLGRNWSRTLELREGHQLVTNGIYRYLRHPMYAAIWLFSLAQGLLLQNWLAGWSAVAAFAVMYFVRVPYEEKMMSEFFGSEYGDYMKRTGRIFPRFRIGNGS